MNDSEPKSYIARPKNSDRFNQERRIPNFVQRFLVLGTVACRTTNHPVNVDDSLGHTVTFKARFVVQGFGQRFGVDYGEVFAPVAKHFLRAFKSDSHRKYHVRNVDVKNAYLNKIF